MFYHYCQMTTPRKLFSGALMVGVAALVVGCGGDYDDPSTTPSTTPTNTPHNSPVNTQPVSRQSAEGQQSAMTQSSTVEQMDRGSQMSEDQWQEIQEYRFEQREQYIEGMEERIAQLHRDIDQLEVDLADSSESVRAAARPKLTSLRHESSELSDRLENARNAEASTWDEIQSGIADGYDATVDGIRSARQWTSEAIAPE